MFCLVFLRHCFLNENKIASIERDISGARADIFYCIFSIFSKHIICDKNKDLKIYTQKEFLIFLSSISIFLLLSKSNYEMWWIWVKNFKQYFCHLKKNGKYYGVCSWYWHWRWARSVLMHYPSTGTEGRRQQSSSAGWLAPLPSPAPLSWRKSVSECVLTCWFSSREAALSQPKPAKFSANSGAAAGDSCPSRVLCDSRCPRSDTSLRFLHRGGKNTGKPAPFPSPIPDILHLFELSFAPFKFAFDLGQAH